MSTATPSVPTHSTVPSSPRAVTDGDTILATVVIAATPERIFRALTTDETETWWGSPDTYRTTEWKADLRVGGSWSVVTLPANGGEGRPASGTFLEIDAPRKLVQTRRYDFDFPALGRRETTVTFRLASMESGGMRVTVRHDGFAGLWEPADQHVTGWERFLGWLADYAQSHP